MRVTGTVTRGGQPVDKLMVNFLPEDGRPSIGRTDADGHYSLQYDKDRAGALLGKHKVWVQIRPANPKEEADIAAGLVKLHPDIDAIMQKYGNRKTTPKTVEVTQDNQVIDLPLD
jgi:hypothetical protein